MNLRETKSPISPDNGLEYNTQRKKLVLSLYGRNIHKLVDYLMTIEDREVRNKTAEEIIQAMEILNFKIKNIENYKQILWTHLAIMSDFKLELDYPYEIIPEKVKNIIPEKLELRKNHIKKRQYGRIIQELIKIAIGVSDEEIKNELSENILIQMKKAFIEWGKDIVNDKLIFDDFMELSENKLHIPENFRLPGYNELKNKTYPQIPYFKKNKPFINTKN